MVQKRKTTNSKRPRSSFLGPRNVLWVSKGKNVSLAKSSQPDEKRFDNYRSFLRYLLSDDIDNELVDGA